MRTLNCTYWPIGIPRLVSRTEKTLAWMNTFSHEEMLEERAFFEELFNLDLLDTSRMSFTPRQARRMLLSFYCGRYGTRSASFCDLARLASIARGKGDPMAKWSEPPLKHTVGHGNTGGFIEDWSLPAKWYREQEQLHRCDFDCIQCIRPFDRPSSQRGRRDGRSRTCLQGCRAIEWSRR